MPNFSPSLVARQLTGLPLWQLGEDGSSLEREFKFADFEQAFAFMTAVAAHASRDNHHPEWRNVYATVWVRWTTHDSGGLTEADWQAAAVCDALALEAFTASKRP